MFKKKIVEEVMPRPYGMFIAPVEEADYVMLRLACSLFKGNVYYEIPVRNKTDVECSEISSVVNIQDAIEEHKNEPVATMIGTKFMEEKLDNGATITLYCVELMNLTGDEWYAMKDILEQLGYERSNIMVEGMDCLWRKKD